MTAHRTVLVFVFAAMSALAAFLALPASAQVSGPAAGSGRGYLGLNFGRTDYRPGCGVATLGCDARDGAGYAYAGSRIGNFWGTEVGVVNMGRIGRAGGQARAQGLNLSMVGRAPLGPVGVFGKIGTTYGYTESAPAIARGAGPGSESGFGLSYGAGLSVDVTRQLSATLAWDSYDFRFAAGAQGPVRAASLGLQYRY